MTARLFAVVAGSCGVPCHTRGVEGGVSSSSVGPRRACSTRLSSCSLCNASLARSAKERGIQHKIELNWNAAVKLASERSESLFMLARTVESWEWPNEANDVLWSGTGFA